MTTLFPVDESRFETWGQQSRMLPLEIWYPSTGEGGRVNRISDMVGEVPALISPLLQLVYGDELDRFWNGPTVALRDAEILEEEGPFPVILFSHGFMGIRYQNYTLAEYLASHGFVLASVEHYGNAVFINPPGPSIIPFDLLSTASSLGDRVEDVAFIFRELEQMNRNSGSRWKGVFDLERFAVSGHSFGGLTSLVSGVDHDFVKAIAPMNPAWFGEFPSTFSKPFFLLQGEHDTFVGGMNEAARRLLEGAASTRKVYINQFRGSHYSSTDACFLIPDAFAALARECDPPIIDSELSNRISNAYMTAFFKSALAGDDRYAGYLRTNHYAEEIELVTTWD